MKLPNSISILLISLALALALTAGTKAIAAQSADSLGWTLAQLRGSWEYRTFDDKFTLNFQDDDNLVLDREPATYTLTGSAMSVNDGDNTTTYPYVIEKNYLTLTLPDGSTRTYVRNDGGKSEQLLSGNYFASVIASRPNMTINFDGAGTFAVGTQSESSDESRYGLYRVQGRRILLSFEDGSEAVAEIQLRDGGENIVRFTYLNRGFESAEAQSVETASADLTAPVLGGSPMPSPVVFYPVVAAPVVYGGGYVAPSATTIAPIESHNTSSSGSGRSSSSSGSSSRSFGSSRGSHR